MAKRVKSRLAELLALRSRKAGKRISVSDLAQATKVSTSAIRAYMYNYNDRYDSRVLIALCEYLQCSVGDLLVIEEDEQKPPSVA